MSKTGADNAIREALCRVGWPGEEDLVRSALREALQELAEIRIIEIGIEQKCHK